MPALFPPAYFAPISYFQKASQFESIVFEVCDTYPKQTLRNRMTILGSNGLQDLSIPVTKPNGSKTTTKDVVLSSEKSWRNTHLRAIQSAYASSPYFEHYALEIQELLMDESIDNLVKLNETCFEKIRLWLDLDVKVTNSINFVAQTDLDFRNSFDSYNNQTVPFYQQVFTDRSSFQHDLSVLDAIFNLGPVARKLIC